MADSTVELALRIPVDASQVDAASQALRRMAAAENESSVAVAASTTAVRVNAGATQNLVYQLFQMSQGLALGMNPMQVLTQQGGQLALALKQAGGAGSILEQGAAKLGTTSASLGASLGVVTIAAMAMGAALAYASHELEAAEAHAAAMAAQATAMQRAVKGTSDAEKEIADQVRLANGEVTQAGLTAEKRIAKLSEEAVATRKLLEAQRDQAEASYQRTQGTDAGGLDFRRMQDAQQALDAYNTRIGTEIELTRELAEKEDREKAAQEAETAAKQAAAEAARRKAEADRAAREAAEAARKEAEHQLRLLEEIVAATGDAMSAQSDQAEVLAGLASSVAALSEAHKTQAEMAAAAALAEADLADALSRGAISIEEYNRLKAEADTNAASGAKATSLNNAAGVVSTVGGGANGLISALGQSGPYGNLISAIINLVAKLDETLSGIIDEVGAIEEQIGNLPNTLLDFVDSFITDIVGGLGEMIGSLVSGLIEAVPQIVGDLTDPSTWIKVGEDIIMGLLNGITGGGSASDSSTWVGLLTGGISNWDIFKGAFASGTDYVPETGLYQLHKGERVWNTSRTSTADQQPAGGSARMSAQSGRLTFEVDVDSYSAAHADLMRRGYLPAGV